MTAIERRYDIDWLRVIAIALLLIYHIGIAFQPWGVFIGFIQNTDSLEWLWAPMSMLNIWRIPLLFFVSGMGVSFALKKRSWKQLFVERSKRILVPFLFGMVAIVPLHVLLWQKYYSQDLSYTLHPVHLWFLANIFIYVILLAPLFFYMKKNREGKIGRWMDKLFRNPLGMLIMIALFVIEAIAMNPESYATFSFAVHGFLVGFLAFLFGFILIYTGETSRRTVIKWKWAALIAGAILFTVRYALFDLVAPNYLVAIESCLWIFAAFGFGFRYLNRPGKAVVYLSQAAYPVYILHMLFLYLGSALIMPLEISALLKFILIILFTFAGCMLTYELIIRRVNFIRPLFGLKINKSDVMKASNKFKLNTVVLKIVVLSLLFVSCDKFDSSAQNSYKTPENLDDGLSISTLEEVGMDTQKILKAADRISMGWHNEVHSMLIYKDNMLVFEEYFSGHKYKWDAPKHHGEMVEWDYDMHHPIMSCTKSFVSACIGIAIDKGYIDDVNQSIFDYLPDYQHLNVDNKNYITIEHLLTMSIGLAWDEWSAPHGTAANDCDAMYLATDDPIQFVLERYWWAEPGTLFTYNSGNQTILAEILKNASGMDIDEFSMKYLFSPLGIDSTVWTAFPNGMIDGGGSLRISPRAMLKFGVTYLNDGVWNGDEIIAEDWVEKSAKLYNNNSGINIPGEDTGKNGYSYSWWTHDFKYGGEELQSFRAGGWGGQEIIVIPERDMVIVFTGGNYAANNSLFKIIERYILPSIE